MKNTQKQKNQKMNIINACKENQILMPKINNCKKFLKKQMNLKLMKLLQSIVNKMNKLKRK